VRERDWKELPTARGGSDLLRRLKDGLLKGPADAPSSAVRGGLIEGLVGALGVRGGLVKRSRADATVGVALVSASGELVSSAWPRVAPAAGRIGVPLASVKGSWLSLLDAELPLTARPIETLLSTSVEASSTMVEGCWIFRPDVELCPLPAGRVFGNLAELVEETPGSLFMRAVVSWRV